MLILVTGGSASGKSEYSENLALSFSSDIKYYIATMFPYDEESGERILRHRRLRKEKNFETIECFRHIEELVLTKKRVVLLECLSNLLANEIYMEHGDEKKVSDDILKGIRHLQSQSTDLILVSNEVFSDGVIYNSDTIEYMRALGRLNQQIAGIADHVVEVVCSIPIFHKGGSI